MNEVASKEEMEAWGDFPWSVPASVREHPEYRRVANRLMEMNREAAELINALAQVVPPPKRRAWCRSKDTGCLDTCWYRPPDDDDVFPC